MGGPFLKTAFALILTYLLCYPNSQAQIPGDFNCNGDVNGVDLVAYNSMIQCCIFNPVDTGSCFWLNGDINTDGISSTIADGCQLRWYFEPERPEDNPPQPGASDSLIISDARGAPGDSVYLPLRIRIDEAVIGFEFHIQFDNRYLLNPAIIFAPDFGMTIGRTAINDTAVFLASAVHPDTLGAGRYWMANIRFNLAPDTPVDTALEVVIVEGCYFPSGLANVSYPVYFITPAISSGRVWVRTLDADEPALPSEAGLYIYPNPFNATTQIIIEMVSPGNARIEIFDTLGRLIDKPLDQYLQSGRHTIAWGRETFKGDKEDLVSGSYFCRLITDDCTISRRMTLVK